jgi:hypothetical protein
MGSLPAPCLPLLPPMTQAPASKAAHHGRTRAHSEAFLRLQLWLVFHAPPVFRIHCPSSGPGLPPQAVRQPVALLRWHLRSPDVLYRAQQGIPCLRQLYNRAYLQVHQSEHFSGVRKKISPESPTLSSPLREGFGREAKQLMMASGHLSTSGDKWRDFGLQLSMCINATPTAMNI